MAAWAAKGEEEKKERGGDTKEAAAQKTVFSWGSENCNLRMAQGEAKK